VRMLLSAPCGVSETRAAFSPPPPSRSSLRAPTRARARGKAAREARPGGAGHPLAPIGDVGPLGADGFAVGGPGGGEDAARASGLLGRAGFPRRTPALPRARARRRGKACVCAAGVTARQGLHARRSGWRRRRSDRRRGLRWISAVAAVWRRSVARLTEVEVVDCDLEDVGALEVDRDECLAAAEVEHGPGVRLDEAPGW
jgi:hypothetical protein